MRLGANSRLILELVTVLGVETLEAIFRLPQFYKTVGCNSEKNFWRRSQLLKSNGLLDEKSDRTTGRWVASLTAAANEAIADGIEPEIEWEAPWDKQWRLFAFDLPQSEGTQRQALRLWLKQRRLGKLQGSLWITPKNLGDWTADLAKRRVDPTAVALFKGQFEGNTSTQSYIDSSWDFKRINERYQRYLNYLESQNAKTMAPKSFSESFHKEVDLWRAAFELDPFLPKELWPKTYLGPKALDSRKKYYATWKLRFEG